MSILSVFIFIIILLVLVMVHELGHFLTAKLTGCRVDEFAFGFPPTLWKKKIGETEYKLNALPIGGYVKIWGEDGGETNDKRVFSNRPKWAQILVLMAGVTMNWLLAFIIFFIIAKSNALVSADDPLYKGKVKDTQLVIVDVSKKSPAYYAGIRPGYIVESIVVNSSNGVASSRADISKGDNVKDFFNKNIDNNITINWLNGYDKGVSTVTGVYGINKDKKAIGISFEVLGHLSLSFGESIDKAWRDTKLYTILTIQGLGELGRGIVNADRDILNSLSGPVGIAKVVGEQTQSGSASNLFLLSAILSINLAVFNLLPFPALDGGRILMVLYEMVTRKKINMNKAALINGIGFVILLLLIVVVTINDFLK